MAHTHTGNHIQTYSAICTQDTLLETIVSVTAEAHEFVEGYSANTATLIDHSVTLQHLPSANGRDLLYSITILVFNGTES